MRPDPGCAADEPSWLSKERLLGDCTRRGRASLRSQTADADPRDAIRDRGEVLDICTAHKRREQIGDAIAEKDAGRAEMSMRCRDAIHVEHFSSPALAKLQPGMFLA